MRNRFLLIFVLLFFQSCVQNKNNEYVYIELDECQLPIPKRFRIIDHSKKGITSLNIIKKEQSIPLEIMFIGQKKDKSYYTEQEIVANLKNTSREKFLKLIQDTIKDKIRVIKHESFMNNHITYRYNLYLDTTSIFAVLTSSTEIECMINHCNNTWKIL